MMVVKHMLAVAQYRKVPSGQILYDEDDLDNERRSECTWQDRWMAHKLLVGLAAKACLALTGWVLQSPIWRD